MGIGLQQLRDSATLMQPVFRSPLLPLFTLVTGIEALAVLALPGAAEDAIVAMLGEPVLGLFAAPFELASILALIFALMGLDLFRTCLWSAMRRIALEGAELRLADVATDALSRMLALFVTQHLIGMLVTAVGLLCLVIGLTMQTFPHILVSFSLAPALYAVVALRRPISHSLSQAARITRHNFFAVFGVQGAILALALWISEFFSSTAISPLVGSYAAITLLIFYRFAHFFGTGTLFLALDEAGEFER